ncbi:MAG: hypothetical protein JWQ40_2836 [Segetibacter sp.]|jgi:uncharacterized membrane protein YqaE (UPF0057 family)|nr:hypothetical protein [Segetibacter sp.]
MKKILLATLCALLFCQPGIFAAKGSSAAPTASTETNSTAPPFTSLQETMDQFKSLSRNERKERIKEVKKAVKQFKADKKAGAAASTNTLLLVIVAILLPPLAVFLHQGEINSKFWIDLLLTLLFYIPGLIYALIVILGNG